MANTGVKDKPWKMQAKQIMVNSLLVTIYSEKAAWEFVGLTVTQR